MYHEKLILSSSVGVPPPLQAYGSKNLFSPLFLYDIPISGFKISGLEKLARFVFVTPKPKTSVRVASPDVET
jgi:hypothetical protein